MTTPPTGPPSPYQQWVDDHLAVVVDGALPGVAVEFQPAQLVVELGDGGRVELDPTRVTKQPTTGDEDNLAAVATQLGITGPQGRQQLRRALDAAGFRLARKPRT